MNIRAQRIIQMIRRLTRSTVGKEPQYHIYSSTVIAKHSHENVKCCIHQVAHTQPHHRPISHIPTKPTTPLRNPYDPLYVV